MKLLAVFALAAVAAGSNMTGLWVLPDGREILIYDKGDGKLAASVKTGLSDQPLIFVGNRQDSGGKTIIVGSTGDMKSKDCSAAAIMIAVGRLDGSAGSFEGKMVIIYALECKNKKPRTFSETVKGKWLKNPESQDKGDTDV